MVTFQPQPEEFDRITHRCKLMAAVVIRRMGEFDRIPPERFAEVPGFLTQLRAEVEEVKFRGEDVSQWLEAQLSSPFDWEI